MSIDVSKIRIKARDLYVHHGYSLTELSEQLAINYSTLASWKRRGAWDEIPALKRIESSIEARVAVLIAKDNKTDADYKELRFFQDQQRKNQLNQAKCDSYKGGVTTEKDFNPKRGRAGRKKAAKKNHLDEDQVEALEAAFLEGLFDYQRIWYDNLHQAIRNILKSRQIGATWYFAREAIVDAFKNGRNKNFLSASKAQAQIFRDYIVQFVEGVTEEFEKKKLEAEGDMDGEAVGLRLVGVDKIVLSNGAIIRFLSTNASTAQGPTGDVIGDEIFWTPNFKKLHKVASAMASQAKWRQSYISTPSTINHQAYPFWTGEHYNKGRDKKKHIHLDVSPKALKDGRLDPDGQWRQVVTIHTAQERGCNLFDIEQLQKEYPPDEFKNLFLCQFVDDTASVFKFEVMKRCMVDTSTLLRWRDFDPTASRPLGNKKVWVGYDPSLSVDKASLVVLAPPEVPGGKFRMLEKFSVKAVDFEYQARRIQEITKRYNVEKMAIDTTGLGTGVYQLVKTFFPRVKKINYSRETKQDLVAKGKDVIENGRLEFSVDYIDVVKSFMTIYQTSTDGGNMTYKARRDAETGHADLAFAILHALSFEQLSGKYKRKGRVGRGK